jgi:large subunit ribosomal protein L5
MGKEKTKKTTQPQQAVKKPKGKKEEQVEKKQAPEASVPEEVVVPRLFEKYKSEAIPAIQKFFNFTTVMQVPKLQKIVINMGVGQATQDAKILEDAVKELETITGQKAAIRKSKKSISNFKLREGMSVGCMVTLRGAKMYEFLDRLISIAIPRIRDFRGVPDKSFDGRGNYTLGIKEHIIFPEINVDKISRMLGMDVTIVTSAKSDQQAYELLKSLGMPFRKKEASNS